MPLRRQLYIIHSFRQHVSEIVSFVSNIHISFTILQINRHSGNFVVWLFSKMYLREPARKAFVTGFNWDTTSISTPSSFFFLLLYFFYLICVFAQASIFV